MNLTNFLARFRGKQAPLDATQSALIGLALAPMYPNLWAEANTEAKRASLIETVAPLVEALDMLDEMEASLAQKAGDTP